MAIPPPNERSTADEVQIDLLRKAGTTRRFALASSLSASVIALSRAAIRTREPELDEVGVRLRWAELHYGRELADKVRSRLGR